MCQVVGDRTEGKTEDTPLLAGSFCPSRDKLDTGTGRVQGGGPTGTVCTDGWMGRVSGAASSNRVTRKVLTEKLRPRPSPEGGLVLTS